MLLQPFGGQPVFRPNLHQFGKVGIDQYQMHLARLRIVEYGDLLPHYVFAGRVSCDDESKSPDSVSQIRRRLIEAVVLRALIPVDE